MWLIFTEKLSYKDEEISSELELVALISLPYITSDYM